MKSSWKVLDYNSSYEDFEKHIDFQPYSEPKVSTNLEQKRIVLNNAFQDREKTVCFMDLLCEALRDCMLELGHDCYVFDWQHCFYSVDLSRSPTNNQEGEWLVEPFPNGDLVFFITSDYRNFYFADGYRQEIWIIGQEMINFFGQKYPKLFTDFNEPID